MSASLDVGVAGASSLDREIKARGIEVLRDVDDTLAGKEWCCASNRSPLPKRGKLSAYRRNECRKQAAMLDRLMSTSGCHSRRFEPTPYASASPPTQEMSRRCSEASNVTLNGRSRTESQARTNQSRRSKSKD
jgi:hypothetical protein